MTISREQLSVGTWIEFHDHYGGIYQGRVFRIGDSDCQVLFEKTISFPSDTKALDKAYPITTSDKRIIDHFTSVPENPQRMLPDYSEQKLPQYPWVVKILKMPCASSTKLSSQAKFFAGPDKYAVGDDGETNGPSGLRFL